MKPLPPEVSLGQLLDIIAGKKPKPVQRLVTKYPLNRWWVLNQNKVRRFSLKNPKDFEREWKEYLESLPPKPNSRFLAMFAEIKHKREIERRVQHKKDKGKARHIKRLRRRSSPAKKIPRSANHGSGGKPDTAAITDQCGTPVF